jgi:hypothetical protein
MKWLIEVAGDNEQQERWLSFCLQFMSDDIEVTCGYINCKLKVICKISVDPYKPIDSTQSMPSFVDQARQDFEIRTVSMTNF